MSPAVLGDDGVRRCSWPGERDDYRRYHDHEWGRPVVDDVTLFEKICLEGFQSGLSWLTILRKRENFRAAFAGFDPVRVAAFGEADVARLLDDAGIVRHEGKIRSAINNAGRVLEVIEEHGSFAAYVWGWEPSRSEAPADLSAVPATTTTSTALANDLKRHGFTFVGPTTVYAFMQAMGLVNDHVVGCDAGTECDRLRDELTPPSVGVAGSAGSVSRRRPV